LIFISVLGSSRIFRLTSKPAAATGIAIERIEQPIAVARSDHLPHRPPMAEEILLATADAGQSAHPGQQTGVFERRLIDPDRAVESR
jgi:hypothetical protein